MVFDNWCFQWQQCTLPSTGQLYEQHKPGFMLSMQSRLKAELLLKLSSSFWIFLCIALSKVWSFVDRVEVVFWEQQALMFQLVPSSVCSLSYCHSQIYFKQLHRTSKTLQTEDILQIKRKDVPLRWLMDIGGENNNLKNNNFDKIEK